MTLPGFIVQVSTTGAGEGRLGVIASRRVGNAVERNRGKRWMRELYRRERGKSVVCGCDVVVVLRPAIRGMEFGRVKEDFCRALERLCEG